MISHWPSFISLEWNDGALFGQYRIVATVVEIFSVQTVFLKEFPVLKMLLLGTKNIYDRYDTGNVT